MKEIKLIIRRKRYTLKPLCLGGVAALYKATHKLPKHPHLTVKVLKKSLLGTLAEERFKREYQTLRNTDAFGIPHVSHKGRLASRPYIAYEFIRGIPVLNLLQHASVTKGIPSLQACIFLKQLLEILRYLHKPNKSIIHGDISPENIIVYKEGIHLIDFGNAQKLTKENIIPEPRWIGKPSYLSPEQAQGVHWDQRSDIYQAGIIFFELLTGKRFNPGKNEQEARSIAANPTTINLDGIPENVQDIIHCMLNPKPDDRSSNTIALLKKIAKLDLIKNRIELERETRFELATSTLARLRSTN